MNKYDRCVQYILDNRTHFYRIAWCYSQNSHDAQDIVQNAIIKALENVGTLRNTNAIRTWFYRILVNEALSFLKVKKREIPYESEALIQSAETSGKGQQALAEVSGGIDDDILSLVTGLPYDVRTIIILHIYEQLTLSETAHAAGIPLSTAKSRYYSGLKQLRSRLEGKK